MLKTVQRSLEQVSLPLEGQQREPGVKKMSKVTQYSAAFAGAAFMTALALGALSGFSAETLFQPVFWIMTVSMAALAGLGMGDGIGGTERRRAERAANRSAMPSGHGVLA
jgi:hypothetical protein